MTQDDLVYRLRTCAAAILAVDPSTGWVALVTEDAANLLIEAANALDVPEPLGDPMPPIEAAKPEQSQPLAQWGGQLSATARGCPACGSVDARTVRRQGRRLMLTCPQCSTTWEYGKNP